MHLKKKLTINKTPKHHSPSKSHKETHPDHTEMDAFNGMIKEYNKQLVASQNPRDFHADLPILQALGAKSYDHVQDLNELQIQLESALKKFAKDWKTVDQGKINYLMKYGIVKEVMMIEERKAIRMLAAAKP